MDILAFLSPCRCGQVSIVMQEIWLPTTDQKIQAMPMTVLSIPTSPPPHHNNPSRSTQGGRLERKVDREEIHSAKRTSLSACSYGHCEMHQAALTMPAYAWKLHLDRWSCFLGGENWFLRLQSAYRQYPAFVSSLFFWRAFYIAYCLGN